ncbi:MULTISPECIES: hypothetical protein [Microbacterium]|uniref:Uncharacterized protein n=1 Tax=Microbacterium mcarthurae TaxID=3035918 RepID=A0ABW9GHK3_9MICO|nr:hypothetical protein [Microbacterium sp. ACRRU]MCG7416383.1 hypothetical protein [Microbacterium sp. ACRRU]
MSSPRFSLPLGVAMAAFGFAQLGAAPQWWNVATTVVMVSGGAILVVQGLISAGRRTRGRATDAL